METKIYMSMIGRNHSISVIVKGVEKRITFSGAEGDMNGVLTTSDLDTQNAIEKSGGFNKRYRLLKKLATPQEKPGINIGKLINGATDTEIIKEAGLAQVGNVEKPIVTNPVILPTDLQLKQVTFKTTNQAQEFFGREHSIPKTKIRTHAEIVAKGLELGYEVILSKE